MPEAADVSIQEPTHGYQLRVVQEVLLALLARRPLTATSCAPGFSLRLARSRRR